MGIYNPSIFQGEQSFGTTAGAPLSTDVNNQLISGISNSQVTATANATTTSGTDAVINTMTITPVAGTYLAMFSAVIQQAGAGQSVTISIYSGGTQDATSVRDFAPFDGGTLSATSASCCAFTHGVYTVNGSQAIAVEWHVSGSTATCFQRKLSLIRLA